MATLLFPLSAEAQNRGKAKQMFLQNDFTLLEMRMVGQYVNTVEFNDSDGDGAEEEQLREEYPEPRRVLYRSMILPGWGQVTNGQIWKVPVVYAIFGGVGYYNYTLTRQYHGFRAAHFNATRGDETDLRFGETPDFVPEGLSVQQLRETRDNLRNQRDLSFVFMFLAYGLNVLDAYVFAHMRSFDVSDDLSANTQIEPWITGQGAPGINVRIQLNRRGNR